MRHHGKYYFGLEGDFLEAIEGYEKIKHIEDLKGDYYISPDGKTIIHLLRSNECDYKWHEKEVGYSHNNSGYVMVELEGKVYTVHRLVAAACMEPDSDPSKVFVDHIDGNKDNNNIDNLRWVNRSENMANYYRLLDKELSRPKNLYYDYVNENLHVKETGESISMPIKEYIAYRKNLGLDVHNIISRAKMYGLNV